MYIAKVKEKLCRQILKDPSLNSLAYRLAGENKKDLLQELALIICEKDEQELEKISNYFNFWCVRVLINMTGNNGNFSKKYRAVRYNYEDVNFNIKQDYDHSTDELIERIEVILSEIATEDTRGWYKKRLFDVYLECGSLRKVEEAVGIDHSSVYLTVKEVKQKIIQRL